MNEIKLYKRENYLKKIRGLYSAFGIIKVITGVRRCGKSSLMTMMKDELLESRIIQVAYTIMQSKQSEDREFRPLENIKDN